MNRTCKKCGWVAFGVTRDFAEKEVARFNTYFDTLTREEQLGYYAGKGSSIAIYEKCLSCGGSYTNFRDSVPGDCPIGCTLSPIITS